MQVLVRDNNVDQALKALKKKMQREGVFREMKLRRHFEKPSERRAREAAEAVRRARRVVTAALELRRADKTIGASLEAAPVVHVEDPEMLAALRSVDFADVCITSGISLLMTMTLRPSSARRRMKA